MSIGIHSRVDANTLAENTLEAGKFLGAIKQLSASTFVDADSLVSASTRVDANTLLSASTIKVDADSSLGIS